MERVPLGVGSLDLVRGDIVRDGELVVRLTPRECNLVRYLWDRRGQVVSREELLENVLGYSAGASTRSLDMAIARLRGKIESQPKEPLHLRTAHGDGYCFYAEEEKDPAQPLHDLLWSASRHVGQLLGVDDCVIYARDGSKLVQAAAFGPKNPAPRQIENPLVLDMGQGIVGSAAAAGRVELVKDTQTDERYVDDLNPGRSELCVPILRQGTLIGVIDSESPKVAAYTENDADVVSSVAQLIASAAADLQRAIS